MAAFNTDEQVIISGLRTRPDLNDKQACVLSFCEETQRYAVQIEDTNERIKVRARNVRIAPQEVQAVQSSAAQPSAPSNATQPTGDVSGSALPSSADESSPSSSTLATKEGTTTRLSLPDGQWEACVLIQDGTEITVLLVATEHGSVSGPTCVRSFMSESTSEEVSAEVEGGELVVFVPAPSVEAASVPEEAEEAEAPIPEEAKDTVEGSSAQGDQAKPMMDEAAVGLPAPDGDSQEEEEEEEEDKENGDDNISVWEASLGPAKHRGGTRGTRGAGWRQPGVKAAGQTLKQPRPRNTETGDKGVAVSCNPNLFYNRSRRAAQARRRASASAAERKKAAHAKAGAQPSWKAERHSFSRTVAI